MIRAFFPLALLLATAPFPALAAAPAWTPVGPFGGEVDALVADPGDARIVYALVAGGAEVYKSVDGGASWSAADHGLLQGAVANALAIDPRRPRTLYLSASGLYKSTNGGASWVSLKLNPRASSLAVDPSGVVYAGTGSGILRSTDGGAHWQRIDGGLPQAPAPLAISDLVADPVQSGVAYAIVNSFTLYKTANGGATWKRQPLKLPKGAAIQTLAVDPRHPANVFAATYAGLFKSTNGGASWALFSAGLPSVVVSALAFDPRGSRTLYAGTFSLARDFAGNGVFRSDDGGATWSPVNEGLTNLRIPALAVGAGGTVYAGTQNDSLGGLFQSLDGRTWRRTVRGIFAQQASMVTVEPAPAGGPAILWAGASNGLFRSPDGGAVWKQLPVDGRIGAVGSIVVDPGPPGAVYVLTFGDDGYTPHLAKTADAGRTWTPLPIPEGVGFALLRRDPHTGTLWLLGDRLERSDDGGVTWTDLVAGGVEEGDIFDDVAFDPSSPNVLYVAGLLLISEQPRLYKSVDGGASWTRIDSEGTPFVDRLLVSPASSAVLYATTADAKLYRSADAGLHWTQVGEAPGQGQFDDLLAAPDGTLYLATSNAGVYASRDGTATALDPEGLESLFVLALALDPAHPDLLYAGTASAGIETHTLPR